MSILAQAISLNTGSVHANLPVTANHAPAKGSIYGQKTHAFKWTLAQEGIKHECRDRGRNETCNEPNEPFNPPVSRRYTCQFLKRMDICACNLLYLIQFSLALLLRLLKLCELLECRIQFLLVLSGYQLKLVDSFKCFNYIGACRV